MPTKRRRSTPPAQAPPKPEDGTTEQVLKADKPNWSLIGLGVALVVVFVAGVVFSRVVGNETTETTTPAAASSTGTTSTVTQASAESTKTTEAKTGPSDTLLTGILGAGAVLILVGALYSRVTSIKVLGAEVGLAPNETDETVKKVTEKLKGESAEKAAEAIPVALEKARAEKQKSQRVELSDSDIDQIASGAVESVR
jgi:uncharacterized membrane protein